MEEWALGGLFHDSIEKNALASARALGECAAFQEIAEIESDDLRKVTET